MARPSPDRTAAIDELTKGLEFVSQLGAILPTDMDRALIDKISGSFSSALVALKSGAREEKSENFDTKKRKMESAQKGRPRKRTQPGSCTRNTTNILEDGYSWRKYGQKNILNSKFPRCYFRCTNKFDQNCPAMRQVQRSEEDSSLYVITYIGEHTCQSRRRPAASLAAPAEKGSACIINFGSSTSHSEDEPKFPPPSSLAPTSALQSTTTTLGAGPTGVTGSGRPEHGDVTSCLQPSVEGEEEDLVWDLDYLNFADVLSFNW
ncbi:putative WRKY transcription factor 70 [Iris pallida]|uniref:WRKY transcription factor 70 n=1 Tax=Iris pallida TaxID=29817 RepID=A0AAX6ELW9_IRIPA|nr:putative WRKY transcription factor 70 [Iris pallida]